MIHEGSGASLLQGQGFGRGSKARKGQEPAESDTGWAHLECRTLKRDTCDFPRESSSLCRSRAWVQIKSMAEAAWLKQAERGGLLLAKPLTHHQDHTGAAQQPNCGVSLDFLEKLAACITPSESSAGVASALTKYSSSTKTRWEGRETLH